MFFIDNEYIYDRVSNLLSVQDYLVGADGLLRSVSYVYDVLYWLMEIMLVLGSV